MVTINQSFSYPQHNMIMYSNKKPLSRLAPLINAYSMINIRTNERSPIIHTKLTILYIEESQYIIFLFVQISNNPVQGVTLSSLQLSTVSNDNLLGGLSTVRTKALNRFHHIHSIDNTPKHHMLTIQPAHTRQNN